MRTIRVASVGGFALIAALPAASNLGMTLVLVRCLSIERFATWSIIEPAMLIFATLTGLGTQYGVLFVTASEGASPARALGAAVTLAFPVAIATAALFWWIASPELGGISGVALASALSAETLAILCVSSLRGQRLLGRWIGFECLRSLGPVIVAAALLGLDRSRLTSVDTVLLLRGGFTLTAVTMLLVSQRVGPVLDAALMRRMLGYGMPIAAAAVVANTISGVDRFLLALLERPAAEIALYAAHQRLAGLLSVLAVTPINLWFAVEAIRRNTDREAGFFQGVLLAVLALLATLMTGACLVGPLLWGYMFPKIAFNPLVYLLLAAAVVPQALGIVLNIGGLREKKTHLNALIVAISGVVVVALGIPLIGAFAVVGAAAARFAAFVSTAVGGRVLSQRIAPVAHRAGPMVPFALAIGLAALALFAPPLSAPALAFTALAMATTGWGVYGNRKRFLALVGTKP